MVKVTFTVDDLTARTLKARAERLQKPRSLVVGEAVAAYVARTGQLTKAERRRLLRAADEMIARPPSRPQADVDREGRAIRRARRAGRRRHRAE